LSSSTIQGSATAVEVALKLTTAMYRTPAGRDLTGLGVHPKIRVDDDPLTDVDEVDPPDNMAADYLFSFSTVGLALRIHDIQDRAHLFAQFGEVRRQDRGRTRYSVVQLPEESQKLPP
jgi:hypothetical protein